ncbi:pyruvate/2-oxoglutarate dehydrogenase complex dihydrolipoamide dehydrogenase (E3) component and related enzyme [Burkholderiales bacterium GJ-E10]|nr:pyruvate/2-oxoglutarate dehydrogenase complex dihydrolipoamide dehydrogenase (E3) component and related enzyme [Burkholderiales bacterium GJ-E10]
MTPTANRRGVPRAAVLVLVVAAIAVFFALGLPHEFTLAGLQAHLDATRAWRAANPVLGAAIFFAAYLVMAGLSLPGAALLTLAGGALFGLLWGTVLVSFGSSVGALGAFLVARHVLRDAVDRRFAQRMKIIDAGIRRDGALYLLTLRLVPVFPFFLVNLLSGLTAMRATTFYWVSQVGMFPATVIYVNAGTRLAGLRHLSGILSPAVLGSFALLAVLPWIGRTVARSLRRRRVYARWPRPKCFDRNLVVIGAGAAGLVTAYIAAAVRAKVTLVEAEKMGGDCLNYGCVPSKALIRSAKLAHQMRHADRYGLEAPESVRVPFRKVMERVHAVIGAVAPHDSVERYTALGVDVVLGRARIVDPWTVEIQGSDGTTRRLTTRSIVIAAGARPFVPPLPGIEDVGYLTSDTLWDAFARLDDAPARVVVLGGGPIGSELAQALARLGSRVHQVEMAPRILGREDEEVSALAKAALEADGVEVLTGHKALRCERADAEKFLVVEHGGETRRIAFDALVCAVGRTARLTGYGLEELGIETNRTVVTNEYLETIYPNIYAAGDVAGPYQFTHTAAHQAWYAAVNALFGDFRRFAVDYRVVPWATFIDPEVARVGLNEQDARERGIAVEVTRYGIDDLDRAIADGATEGFVKVLTEPGRDRILGVTIVGEHAGDLLAEFVLAMRWDLGLKKILSTIHTYPTLAEANKYAAGAWRRAHAPKAAPAWLERFHRWRRG